ncbi:MAG TPA: hypothetical protein PKN33_05030 [Phycisphaerae bacterium]|nr:hypothetical protein [Phycisphaerae bacterium]
MSVIGDALGRAERDYQAGHNLQKAPVPTRVSKKPATEPAETAVKGIARPRQSQTAGGGWFSNVLMVLFVAVIGFAGYMTVYPDWVDSLWKFPDLQTPVVQIASNPVPTSNPMQINQSAPPVDAPPATIEASFPVCPQVAIAVDRPVERVQVPPSIPVESTNTEWVDSHSVPHGATPIAKSGQTVSSDVPTPLQPTLPESSMAVEVQPIAPPVEASKPIVVEAPAVSVSQPTIKPVVDEIEKPTPKKRARLGRRVSREKPQTETTRSLARIPIQSSKLSDRFKVEGVMLGGERKSAVINGEIVGIDDEVDGAVVRAITDSGIAIEIDGRIRRVPVISKRKHDGPDQPMTETEFND